MSVAYSPVSPVPQSPPLDLSGLRLTDEQFYQLCTDNPEQPLELTREGVLIVMAPVGGESGKQELNVGSQLYVWNQSTGLGEVFSSSTIFKLPLGEQRSPDAAWVALARWNALSQDDREKFPPLAPDFLIELRSRTDSLSKLQDKMLEYQENAVRLGVLITPPDKQVELYRLGQETVLLQSPQTIDCGDVLPGFSLSLAGIW